MRPDHNDLRSASFTLELIDVMAEEERLVTLATSYGVHRVLVREQTLSVIELWARDEKRKAMELRELTSADEYFQQGMAQGIEVALVGLRRVIRELRVS